MNSNAALPLLATLVLAASCESINTPSIREEPRHVHATRYATREALLEVQRLAAERLGRPARGLDLVVEPETRVWTGTQVSFPLQEVDEDRFWTIAHEELRGVGFVESIGANDPDTGTAAEAAARWTQPWDLRMELSEQRVGERDWIAVRCTLLSRNDTQGFPVAATAMYDPLNWPEAGSFAVRQER